MTQFDHPDRGILSLRRLTLLGSVAVVGAALALGGPLGIWPLHLAGPRGHDAGTAGPGGLCRSVDKVKPR